MDDLDLLRTEIESGEQFKTVFQGFDKKQVTETVTQLTVDKAELSNKLEKALSENINLKKQLRDLQRENAELQRVKQIASAPEVDVDALKAEIEQQFKAQIDEMSALLDEAMAETQAAQDETKKAQAQIDAAQKEAKAAKDEAENAKKAIEAAKNEAAAAKSEAEAAKKAAANAGSAAPKAQEAPKPAPAKEAAPSKSMSDAGTRFVVDELKSQIAKLQDEKRKRGLRIAELEEMLQEEKNGVDGKIAMLTSLNDNMATMLREKISELNDFAGNFRDVFKSVEDSIKEAEVSIKEAEENFKTTEEKLSEMNEFAEGWKDAFSSAVD